MTLTGRRRPLTHDESLALNFIMRDLRDVRGSFPDVSAPDRAAFELPGPDQADSREPDVAECVARHFRPDEHVGLQKSTVNLFLQCAASWERIVSERAGDSSRAEELFDLACCCAAVADGVWLDEERRASLLAVRHDDRFGRVHDAEDG